MWRKIADFFRAPIFPDDEEKTRRARVITALNSNLLLAIFLGGGAGILFFFVEKQITSTLVIIALLMNIFLRVLIRKGWVNRVSTITLIALWVFTVFMIYLSNGMHSLDVMFFLSGTIVAGILLGVSAALLYAGFSAIAGLGFALMAQGGYIFPIKFPLPPLSAWVMLLVNFGFTIIPLNIMFHSLADALARARQEIKERAQIQEQLRANEIFWLMLKKSEQRRD